MRDPPLVRKKPAGVAIGQAARTRVRAGGEVRAHVERAEEADVLVRARDAGASDAVCREPVEALGPERDRPVLWIEVMPVVALMSVVFPAPVGADEP